MTSSSAITGSARRDAQRARRMTEAQRAGGGRELRGIEQPVEHRARNVRRHGDRDGAGTHHRVMQLAHRDCAREQVDVVRADGDAA